MKLSTPSFLVPFEEQSGFSKLALLKDDSNSDRDRTFWSENRDNLSMHMFSEVALASSILFGSRSLVLGRETFTLRVSSKVDMQGERPFGGNALGGWCKQSPLIDDDDGRLLSP